MNQTLQTVIREKAYSKKKLKMTNQ